MTFIKNKQDKHSTLFTPRRRNKNRRTKSCSIDKPPATHFLTMKPLVTIASIDNFTMYQKDFNDTNPTVHTCAKDIPHNSPQQIPQNTPKESYDVPLVFNDFDFGHSLFTPTTNNNNTQIDTVQVSPHGTAHQSNYSQITSDYNQIAPPAPQNSDTLQATPAIISPNTMDLISPNDAISVNDPLLLPGDMTNFSYSLPSSLFGELPVDSWEELYGLNVPRDVAPSTEMEMDFEGILNMEDMELMHAYQHRI